MGLRNLEDNSRIRRKNSDLSYREGRTAWSPVEPFLQVRFHRNIAASSLAADCNIPQRPPAFLISNKLKVSLKTVCHNGVHAHSGPIYGASLLFTATQIGTWYGETCGKDGSDIPSWFQFEKLERTTSAHIDSSVPKNSWTWALRTRSGNTLRNIAPPAATTRPGACKLGGEERGEVDPAIYATKHPGTHQRGEEEEEGAPSYELLIQGHTWGEKEKEKEKEEKKRRRREDKRRSQLCASHPRTRQEGGDGVAAEVHELVVVEIHNLHYTPSVNGFDLCHPLSEDCCCQ